jgi:hypothetical protein
MPSFNMGETLNIDKGGLFVKLKSKGNKIKFRLIKGGYYDGKHFIKNGENWIVSYCPRIMNELPCEHCVKYFDIRTQANLIEDKKEKESVMKEAQKFQVKMTFYYPIIDREDGKGKILKTTMSVRQDLEAEFKDGINVFDYDYVLTRTEESPAKYYKLTRMDSKQCVDLTDEEVKEMGKLGSMNLEELCGDVKASTQTFTAEEKVEDIIIPDEEEDPNGKMPF